MLSNHCSCGAVFPHPVDETEHNSPESLSVKSTGKVCIQGIALHVKSRQSRRWTLHFEHEYGPDRAAWPKIGCGAEFVPLGKGEHRWLLSYGCRTVDGWHLQQSDSHNNGLVQSEERNMFQTWRQTTRAQMNTLRPRQCGSTRPVHCLDKFFRVWQQTFRADVRESAGLPASTTRRSMELYTQIAPHELTYWS